MRDRRVEPARVGERDRQVAMRRSVPRSRIDDTLQGVDDFRELTSIDGRNPEGRQRALVSGLIRQEASQAACHSEIRVLV